MAFVSWLPSVGGDWDTASNWSTGVLPTSNDQVTISTATIQTITHSKGNDFAGSLAVGNDIFEMEGGSLGVVSGAAFASGFTLTGGSMSVGTSMSIASGATTISGGTLAVGASLKIIGSLVQTNGTITAQNVTVTGTAQLLGGVLEGTAVFTATGAVTVANYAVKGSAELNNASTMSQTGNLTLGDVTGIDATVLNQKGATYNFANAVSISGGAATAQLVNNGTLAALAGTGTSTINVQATSSGTLSVGSGSTLVFAGALTSLGGTITGAGTLDLSHGGVTLAAGATINVTTLALYGSGTTLTLGGDETMSGAYSQGDNSLLRLNGHTLTLAGAAQFVSSPLITGPGTLKTMGATSVTGGPVIGGGATWSNSGTVTDSHSFQVGDSSGTAATVSNAAGGVFNLTASGLAINNGGVPTSSFVNAGTLQMLAGSGVSKVDVTLTSTGTLAAVAGGNLEIDGPSNIVGGTISGAGQVSFAGGGSTTLAGATITVGTLALYGTGTTLTLGGNETVSGAYSQGDSSQLHLNGYTLTLAGAAQFASSPLITGPGTLKTTGATGVTGGPVIGGGATWNNSGTVTDSHSFQVGDSSGTAATVTNAVGGVFNLTASGIAINNGGVPTSSFVNTGTLQMLAGSGVSKVNVTLTSTGTLAAVAGGNLEIDGPSNIVGGKISGAGQVSFAGGGSTTLAGATITVGTLALYGNGTTLTLGGNETVSGAYSQADSSQLHLNGHTLTLAGSAQFASSPLITGPGTLKTMGATSVTGSPVIGGGATWSNSGTVTDSHSFQVGDSSGTAATVTNVAGGVFNLTSSGISINNGGIPTSSFVNVGTLQMLAGSGTDTIGVNLSSSGAITVVAGGALNLTGPSNSIAGTISGAGQVTLGGASTTLGILTIGGTAVLQNTKTVIQAAGADLCLEPAVDAVAQI